MTKAEHGQRTTSRRPKSRIPTFKTVEEAAAFWDTHDSAAFEDELEDVPDVMFVRAAPKKGMTVRLEQETLAALTAQAHKMGIGPSTLARMWILERLRADQRH